MKIGNYGYGSVITLGNQLTRFESDVFRSVVENIQPFAPEYARISIDSSTFYIIFLPVIVHYIKS